MNKLANLLNEKKLNFPSEKEVELITGLQVNGISPLTLIHKGFTIVLDYSAQFFEDIHISGGQRGLNLLIIVQDLISLINPKIAEIT